MEVLFHTILVEPARWKAHRVFRPFTELAPAIARAGFRKLEIYEPHLALAEDEGLLPRMLEMLRLEPIVLSSYLNPNPAVTDDATFEAKAEEMEIRVRRFGFRKVRLFPGSMVDPGDDAAVAAVRTRVAHLAQRLPDVDILLETHDRSIADSPERLVQLVEEVELPNVGLLFQPTRFDPEFACRQWALQAPYVRHMHVQNRTVEGKICLLAEGVINWGELVKGSSAAGSLEFVPASLEPEETFDLEAVLTQAASETEVARAF